MSRAVYVVFASMIAVAGLPRTVSWSFPADHPAMQSYVDDADFIDDVMATDMFWFPIVRHPVNMTAQSRDHTDHFGHSEANRHVDAEPQQVIPFDEIVKLKMSNSSVGTEVKFVVEAVKRSLLCFVMKYVSMKGFLLHHYISREDEEDVSRDLLKWMQRMLRISIDKLAAVDKIEPSITSFQFHVTTLLLDEDADLMQNELHAFSQKIVDQMGSTCANPEGSNIYNSVVMELKKSMTELEFLDDEIWMANNKFKDYSDLYHIKTIMKNNGPLQIKDDVSHEEFNEIEKEELKKIMVVIYYKFHQLLLNLHVKTMAESQWTNVLAFTNSIITKNKISI